MRSFREIFRSAFVRDDLSILVSYEGYRECSKTRIEKFTVARARMRCAIRDLLFRCGKIESLCSFTTRRGRVLEPREYQSNEPCASFRWNGAVFAKTNRFVLFVPFDRIPNLRVRTSFINIPTRVLRIWCASSLWKTILESYRVPANSTYNIFHVRMI